MSTVPSTLPPPPVYARGFDVSKYSGVVDFSAFRADGFEFVIVRASVGLSPDPRFEDDAKAARDAGLVVGTYHGYFDTLDPEKQATLYAGLVAKMGFAMMEPCSDFELLHGVSGRLALDRALAFQVACEAAWKITPEQSALYTYPSFWNALPDCASKTEFGRRKLYIAHYGVPTPTIPKTWTDFALWQHRGNEVLHGSMVDLDCYKAAASDIPLYQVGGS